MRPRHVRAVKVCVPRAITGPDSIDSVASTEPESQVIIEEDNISNEYCGQMFINSRAFMFNLSVECDTRYNSQCKKQNNSNNTVVVRS